MIHRVVWTNDRDENGLVSLAEVCHKILSDPERRQGAKSHAKRAKNRKIDECRYLVCPVRISSGEGLKFVFKGFEKDDGLCSD